MVGWHHKIDEKDFEELIRDLFNAEHNTNSFQIYGRNGQKQYGVDVFSVECKTLIQCKYKENIDKPKLKETIKQEIIDEVKKVFSPGAPWHNEMNGFIHFIYASTYYHDTELQDFVFSLKDSNGRKHPINISYLGREIIIRMISKNDNIMLKYFPGIFEKLVSQTREISAVPKIDLRNVIGRHEELIRIKTNLNSNSFLLLTGVGGIGKTTIALGFANNKIYSEAFENIAWVTVNHDFVQDFTFQLKGLLGKEFNEKQNQDSNFSLLLRELRKIRTSKKKDLLIIDNWNSYNEILQYYQKLIDTQWVVMVTTRTNSDFSNFIEIKELPQNNSIELFKKYHPNVEDDKILDELLSEIDCHTLLIELIAKVGHKRGKDIATLKQIVSKASFKAKELQRKIEIGSHSEFSERDREARIYDYVISIFDLDELSEHELFWLRHLSILPNQLELPTLKELFGIKSEEEIDFEEALDELHKRGWLNLTSKYVNLHSIIQKVLIEKLTPTANNCILLIVNLWKKMRWNDVENTYAKTGYLPYAESILSNLNEKHLDLGQIARYCSIIYFDQRQTDKAIFYGKKVVEIYEAEIKEQDIGLHGLMTGYKNLATYHFEVNDIESFNLYNERYISTAQKYVNNQEEFEKETGLDLSNELDKADIFEAIASSYEIQGNFLKVLEYQKKSLDIRINQKEKDVNGLILLYGNIATTYNLINENYTALKYNENAIELSENYLPINHKYSITAINNYSVTLGKLNNWPNSLKQALKAYEANKINYDDIIHPTFGEICFNIALAYLMQGKKKLAKEYIKKAIACWEQLPFRHENMQDAITFYQDLVKTSPIASSKKIGRNETCPCGSGLKYKKCCGK